MAIQNIDTKQVQVVALERGHDGEYVRKEGEVFAVDAWRLEDGSNWYAPVDSEAGKAAIAAAAARKA